MFYYLYLLHGPLKSTKLSLTSHHYSFFLYQKDNEEHSDNGNDIDIFIPCDNKISSKTIDITLDTENVKNNILIIKNSVLENENGEIEEIELDRPIYFNNVPVLLISKSDSFDINKLQFQSQDNNIKKNHSLFIFLITMVLLLCTFFFILSKKISTEPTTEIESTLSLPGYAGTQDYYCLYSHSPQESIMKENKDSKYIYVDIDKITHSLSEDKNKINNLILSNKQTPTFSFIYQNEQEKKQNLTLIHQVFPKNCQPKINAMALNNLISDINKINFIKESDYQIKKEKNKIFLIFNSALISENKIILNQFIKKQTSLFGRKFIFYQENISQSTLKDKAILQEKKGYIFIDDQHRYFPNG